MHGACDNHDFTVKMIIMVFNATFNNISVISQWSVLLMEETGGPREGSYKSNYHTITTTTAPEPD